MTGHTTCLEDRAAAVRAWARGWLPTEAAAELLIGHRAWLLREDFWRVAAEVRWEAFRGQDVAAVDFAAASSALEAGLLPCSPGEREILRIAASVAEGIPVDLREAAFRLDAAGADLAASAIVHAAGYRRPGLAARGDGR
jgi:hypothetical protein